MTILAEIIHRVFQLLILIVIVQAFLTWFMDPYHPVRRFLDRFVSPILTPIRRIIPPIGGIDISPIVLIVILEVIDTILMRVLSSL